MKRSHLQGVAAAARPVPNNRTLFALLMARKRRMLVRKGRVAPSKGEGKPIPTPIRR